jgi:hypothetical protein
LSELAADAGFVAEVERLARARRSYLETPGWFPSACEGGALSGVAYFSMEFGIAEALPLYAGGFGILAGDFLKTASDLGLPVVGIGLLYQEGYFISTPGSASQGPKGARQDRGQTKSGSGDQPFGAKKIRPARRGLDRAAVAGRATLRCARAGSR